MASFSNILVPTDFSEPSHAAVDYAVELAATFGSSLHLLHVVADPLHDTWACYASGLDFLKIVQVQQADAHRRLESLAPKALRDVGRVRMAAPWGQVTEEILEYAREHEIDLIVCGTHGRRGWDLVWLGSVAERIVRLAPCPVLAVRPKLSGFDWRRELAGDRVVTAA